MDNKNTRLTVILFLVFLILRGGISTVQAQIKSWEDPLPSGPSWDDYQPGPDSLPQSGVPQGETLNFDLNHSVIFPGTVNRITVYIPEQYRGDRPACVYVGLDGLGFNAINVFNNLIHKKEMPVTIGIGIAPGFVPSNEMENPRFNRSFEFDGISDAFCRFLLEEVFPEVEKRKTKNGLPIRLSKDPNDRCCGGGSTGGVGSFTLAWQRPDQFRRVFSAVGTFVCMRGGDQYHVLVRKTEPKPIRVFMQDGHSDQCMGDIGDWWMGNLTLKRSLEFAGYDVQWNWGTGKHSGKHGTQIFPEAMRMLWRDWPKPITAKPNKNFSPFYNEIIADGESWTPVNSSLTQPEALFSAPDKSVICVDSATQSLWKLSSKSDPVKIASLPSDSRLTGSEAKQNQKFSDIKWSGACSADGTIYLGGKCGLFAFKPNSKSWTKIIDDLEITGLTILDNRRIYATDALSGTLWRIDSNGQKKQEKQGLAGPTGIAATPDHQWLAVLESHSHWGTSFRLEKDGAAVHGQRFYWFHVPDVADDLGTGRGAFDTEGRLYVATRLGVAALDRNGRTRLIMPGPALGGQAPIDDLCFGDSNQRSLYIISDGKIFKRTLKTEGAPNFLPSKKLPKWRAG